MSEEENKIAKLMQPRFKVIADYPESPFEINSIFTADDYKLTEESSFVDIEFREYPHLFRELQWWEDRKEDEMPEYVKVIDVSYLPQSNTVFKIIRWEIDEIGQMKGYYSNDKAALAQYLLVATSSEYTTYNKTK